jgi:hypothetical protein
MIAARAALAAVRAAHVALGVALDALDAAMHDDGDELFDLDDAGERFGIPASTLRRWARDGRLRAVELERGRVACWRSALIEAIDAAPYRPAVRSVPAAGADDLLEDALASGELRAGGRR